jgi:hypothetical protein
MDINTTPIVSVMQSAKAVKADEEWLSTAEVAVLWHMQSDSLRTLFCKEGHVRDVVPIKDDLTQRLKWPLRPVLAARRASEFGPRQRG